MAGEGELLGLIGPNGAGKTTLFNIISGVLRPENGRVLFAGRDIIGLPQPKICRLGIARTFQIPQPFPNMTVLENIRTAAFFAGARVAEKQFNPERICELVGLAEKRSLPARSLNISEKKHLEVARALATSPRVILIDEFAAGLTSSELGRASELVKRINGELGLTVLWTEHVMRVLMRTVRRVAVLHNGRKIAEGSPEEIVKNEDVQSAYLGRSLRIG